MTINDPRGVRLGTPADAGALSVQESASAGVVARVPTLNGNLPGRESPLPDPQRETVARTVGDDLR